MTEHSHAPGERIGKSALAAHLGEWHGRSRVATPTSELMRWTAEELNGTHAEQHRNMEGTG